MRYLPPLIRSSARVLTLLLVAACGGSEPTAPTTPPPPVAGSLTLVSGNAQSGVAGAALGAPLVVNVKTTDGAAMSGQAVAWAVAGGGGAVSQASTNTGADGNASVTWTLGGAVGAQSVIATTASFSVTFTAQASAGPVAQVVVTPSEGSLEALDAAVQLAVELKDQFGNPTEGSVTWASTDTSVVVVDSTGSAKAVGNGSADVVATASAVSGTATLTVAQKVASVAAAPANVSIAVGKTGQVTAEAKDANGFLVKDPPFGWSSSDTAVATVDSAGLVSGVAEGSAVVRVASGDATDSVAVTVTPDAFRPTEDTEISDSLNVGELEIPDGVTVTLKNDAVINVEGSVTISGSVKGDCVGAQIVAGGDLTVTGSLDNTCSQAAGGELGLSLRSNGAIVVEGANLESSGPITVSNVPPQSAGAAWRSETPLPATEANACRWSTVGLRVRRPAGADAAPAGQPRGADGAPGHPVTLECAGDLLVYSALIHGHPGQHGGAGSSPAGAPAMGGDGGAGGDIVIRAGGSVTFRNEHGPVRVYLPNGGNGGGGSSYGTSPVGIGGKGGRIGLLFVSAGDKVIVEAGGLEIWDESRDGTTRGGAGGEGWAHGDAGANATETSAAEKGQAAEARGGMGGSVGLEGRTTRLIGDLFQGVVEGAENIRFMDFELRPGPGGRALGSGGNGGDGSRWFPDGADAGATLLVGGEAGPVTLFDNRGSGVFLAPGADGGNLSFQDPSGTWTGQGGRGWGGCVVGAVASGGRGGNASQGTGTAGLPSLRGEDRDGMAGRWSHFAWGNGGNGGDGDQPGDGGAPGDPVIGVTSGVDLPPADRLGLRPGTKGSPCAYVMEPAFSVTSDPNGHAPFIGLGSVTQLSVTMGRNNTLTITGNGVWVTLSGTVAADGSFSASGVGTVAGFSGVTIAISGTLSLDSQGRLTGISSASLVMDVLNAVLPEDENGIRNPAQYSVSAGVVG